MQEEIEKLQEALRDRLPEKRFWHTVGVRYTAEALAMRYGVSIDKAALAGVLHDCAKYMHGEKMLAKCHKYNISVTDIERQNPQLLHAKLGVYYAKYRYGVEEEEILSAIRWHTTGRAEMAVLEKIVFLADYIEPHRKQIDGLEQIRKVAFVDLDQAVYLTLKNTVDYLKEQTEEKRNLKVFDPSTQAAYEYYRKQQLKEEKV